MSSLGCICVAFLIILVSQNVFSEQDRVNRDANSFTNVQVQQ